MLSMRRALAVLLSLGFLAGLTACSSLLWAQADQAAPAQPPPRGQVPPPAVPPAEAPVIGKPPVFVPGVKPAAPGNANEFTDAITLPTDRDLKKRLDAAEEYIREEAWGLAARLLQSILDNKEDVFVQVRRKGVEGQESIHWASARAEVNRLIGSMPIKGLEFYQLQYGAQGMTLLEESRKKSDPQLLAEVAQKYFHTEAGAEATNLLGTYHLDRGRPLMAALCFERLLQREGIEPTPLILLKATLAYRLIGDQANAQQTMRRLSSKTRREGLRLADRSVGLEQLQRELDRMSVAEPTNPYDWPVFRGNASRSAQGNGSAPFLDKRWQRPTVPERSSPSETRQTRTLIEEAIASLQRRPEALMPGFFPIAAGGKLIYRSYWGIHAVEIKTGELTWESPSVGSLDALVRDVQKWGLVRPWFDWYKTGGNLNVLFENSTLGTLSTDNTFVYAVDDLALPPHPNTMQQFGWGAAPNFGLLQEAAQQNRLQAFDLESGKLIWELGGPRDTSELNGSYFLGPPLPLGGKLYVLTEKNSELRLVCLDPTRKGEVVWTQAMATTRDRLLLDPGRRVQSVNLAYGEGILVCPTNAGAILGVDLLSHSLIWAHPYREGVPPALPQRPFPGRPWVNANSQSLTSPDWKVSAPTVQDGKVVFTAPDGAAVHCLNLRNGDLLWEAKRVDDLYLAGVFSGKVVLVGKNSCRALSLNDGKPLWKMETGMPSGQGVACDNVYYLPLKRAEVCAIDLDKGLILGHARSRKNEIPGNLIFYEGDVLSQTESAVTAYPQLKVKLAQIDELLQRNPLDPLALTERGELRLDKGDLAGAVADLRTALSNHPPPVTVAKTREKLYETLKELLQRDFSAGEEYLDEFKLLCTLTSTETVPAEDRKQLEKEQRQRQASMWGLIARGREQQGRLLEAFQAYLEFATLAGTEEQIGVPDDPALRARGDVWAQGRIAALVAKANEEQRKPLEQELARRWSHVQAANDTDTLRRCVTAFGSLFAVGREARLLLAERLMEESNFIEAELHLLQLRRQDDARSAAQATEALARLATRKGLLEDAAHYYRILGRDYASVVVRDGKTGADYYNELATDKRFLPFLDEPGSPVLGGNVRVKEIPGVSGMPQGLITFDPKGDLLPFFQRHRLVLSQNTYQLRLLDRDTGEERWSQVLTRSYLYNPGGTGIICAPYQVQGHLVVLNLGHMIYGFDLLERKKLWERNLFGQENPNQYQVGADQDGGLTLYNMAHGSSERIGQIGPITASYLCLQTREGLIALDPVRGHVLWTKTDVPARTQIFGDDQYVYLIEVRNDGNVGAGRALRGQDGAPVDVPDFSGAYQRRQRILGGRLLLTEHDGRGGLVLRYYDVQTGRDLLRRTFAANSLLLRVEDPELAGIVEPTGKLTVIHLPTRQEVLQAAVDVGHLAKAQELFLIQDQAQFYVAINRTPEANANFQAAYMNLNGLRSTMVNGALYAFDRGTGKLRWNYEAPYQQYLLLEQFQDLPMILLTARYNRVLNPAPNLATTNVVATRSLDKRTGKLIYDKEILGYQQPGHFYALQIDRRAGTFDLIANSMKLRHYLDEATATLSWHEGNQGPLGNGRAPQTRVATPSPGKE